MTAAFSIDEHTIIRQAAALILDEQQLRLKVNVPLALAAILLMCGDHDSLLSNITPR